ncbi:MAG: DUF1294 domain-containing protein [Anaerobacillus sp.]
MLFLIYLFVVNLWSFLAMGLDKRRAKKRGQRIPEKTLWFLIVVGGSLGGYLGMKSFRHKTKHSSFVYGVPIALLVHVFLIAGYVYFFI